MHISGSVGETIHIAPQNTTITYITRFGVLLLWQKDVTITTLQAILKPTKSQFITPSSARMTTFTTVQIPLALVLAERFFLPNLDSEGQRIPTKVIVVG